MQGIHRTILNVLIVSTLTSAAICLLLFSGIAHAQVVNQSERNPEDPTIENIVVTGTRLAPSGYETPTPVTTVGQEQMAVQPSQEIAEFVNELPALAGSETATTNSYFMGGGEAGTSGLNLRALGSVRTLVLLNGHRSSVSVSSGIVDTNTMPQGLIERVEIVSGGASAAYGTGAVGGVVNFILDDDYTGVKSTFQYGETTYGENNNNKFTLTAGSPFADERGHFLLNGELSNTAGIHPTMNRRMPVRRDWNAHSYHMMLNPDQSAGQPAYVVDEFISPANYAPGGLIVSGPLRGTYFGLHGTVNQFDYGELGPDGRLMRGGDWELNDQSGQFSLNAAQDRRNIFSKVSYDISSDLAVFAEASYATYEGYSTYIHAPSFNIPIERDNAFLPTAVGAAMDDAGIDSFRMSTINVDAPFNGNLNSRDTQRYVVGADGLFTALNSNMSWDFYYQKSITEANQLYYPAVYNLARLAMATDAVVDPLSNEIVCRSTLTDPSNGCVPLNRFGVDVTSPEDWDYVTGAPERDQEFELDVASINFRVGEIPGFAAGPISTAFGVEWRKQEIRSAVAEQHKSGWRFGNFQEDFGHFDVFEVYGEAQVPLTEGLDLNGAFRWSDYSTSGDVKTWKAGLTYSPLGDELTVRITQSRDIRAPSLGELFASGSSVANTLVLEGELINFRRVLQGSTRLEPETADSFNAGVVLTPSFLPDFGASIDYYDVEVKGVIGNINAERTVDFCFELSIQSYCDNLHFADPSDLTSLEYMDIYYENLNYLRAKGVDIELTYGVDLDEVFDGGAGYLDLRAFFTHYIDTIVADGTLVTNWAGSNAGDTPDLKYRLSATYALEPWTLNLTARGVSDGVIMNSFIECTSNCPPSVFPNYTVNDNSVDGQIVFDAYLARNFRVADVDMELFFSARNLLNTDPPRTIAVGGSGNIDYRDNLAKPQTNRYIYDFLGRRFMLGARVSWGD